MNTIVSHNGRTQQGVLSTLLPEEAGIVIGGYGAATDSTRLLYMSVWYFSGTYCIFTHSWALVVLEPSITGEGLWRETGYRLDAATIRVNVWWFYRAWQQTKFWSRSLRGTRVALR
jgi:hypothetical protein